MDRLQPARFGCPLGPTEKSKTYRPGEKLKRDAVIKWVCGERELASGR